ncbi:hypothetical protein PtA15_1A952 [Puccinia triticina]|uniref:Uncharacterized protein n=1 Tax=Puccinia triticina TaxID=208348 RepID=A0ABY7C8W1_9BASI|nr:uncharacterized protein PtA15_1A952 [Puccinia triticina]WAQ81610.1 hypothetical protein PtA15_1A952 [Puccinia triticina]
MSESSSTVQGLVTALHELSIQCLKSQDVKQFNFEKANEEVKNDAEAKGPQEQVHEIDKFLLPSCRQQLKELIELLDVALTGTDPNPKLPEALKLVKELGPTLLQLHSAATVLAPPTTSMSQISSSTDQNDGDLKEFRLNYRSSGVTSLIGGPLRDLILEIFQFILTKRYAYNDSDSAYQRFQIISVSRQVFSKIDQLIAMPTRSDEGVLKIDWESSHKQMGDCLAKLNQRVDESVDGPSEGVFRSRVVELSQKAIPLVQLARVFFKNLVYDSLFTFDGELSSAELDELRRSSKAITFYLANITDSLLRFHRNEQVGYTNTVPACAEHVKTGMTEALGTFRALAKPKNSNPTITSEEAFSELSSLMKSQFFPACDALWAAAQKFAADYPAAR